MAPSDDLQPEPLTEAAFIIPLSLAAGPKPGYAILKEVESLSQGRILFSAGTLYGGLKRFLRRDWIRRVHGKGKDESGRPRKEMEKSRPLAVRRFANGALGAGIGGLLGLGCAGLAWRMGSSVAGMAAIVGSPLLIVNSPAGIFGGALLGRTIAEDNPLRDAPAAT